MPNWVFNKVYFYGDKSRIQKLKNFLATEDSVFDFNTIIPMPKELNLVSGSDEDFSIKCAKAYRDHGLITTSFYEESKWQKEKMSFMDWVALGNKYLANKEKYGATTWYDWCIEHWGTKWNACDATWEGDNFVCFNTAWGAPEPVYQRLSELFPDIEFSVLFADEDLGNNCGTIDYSDGHFSTVYEDSLEFACDVWGYDYEEMREECAYD